MRELADDLGLWPVVAVCLVVAIAIPASAARQLTPGLLREAYVITKPGRVIAIAVVLLVLLAAVGAGVALLAIAVPAFWAVEATMVSGIGVVVLYLVRYRAAARAYDGGGLGEPDDDGAPRT